MGIMAALNKGSGVCRCSRNRCQDRVQDRFLGIVTYKQVIHTVLGKLKMQFSL